MQNWKILLKTDTFDNLRAEYYLATGFHVAFFADGEVRMGNLHLADFASVPERLSRMIGESVRWGEPNINMLDNGSFLWCVPLCVNNEVSGGFFSGCEEETQDPKAAGKVREAAWKLLDLCTRYNFVNSGLMQCNRMVAQTAAKKAEAIHLSKHFFFQNPRDLLLIEEREILSAIKNKNVEKAREIINRILVGVYNVAGTDFEALKILILEMVVQMYRAAVGEGAESEALFGVNSSYLVDFLKVDTEEALTDWLLHWLESFVKINFTENRQEVKSTLGPAILYIKRNLDKPISRDQVAAACRFSPGHLSRLIKDGTGYTYSDLLNRFRIEHACSLLDKTSLNISEIAYTCGFNDQSYFTKVFKKVMGEAPGRYRSENRYQKSPA